MGVLVVCVCVRVCVCACACVCACVCLSARPACPSFGLIACVCARVFTISWASGRLLAGGTLAVAARAEGRQHRVRECYGYVVCEVRGAYAQRRRVGLAGACAGRSERPDKAETARQRRAVRIRSGLRPKMGQPLTGGCSGPSLEHASQTLRVSVGFVP